MRKTKKALAIIAIAGMTLSMIPFNVFASGTVPTRIAGLTAEQTAVAIANQTGYAGTAIIASSTSYGMVDALTAGPLATSLKAPILLTGTGNTLDVATKAELIKLAVKKVYLTSGTAVIKQGVIDELKGMGIEVEALGGFDRSETSVNIAKKMTGVTKVAIANTVVDALSIAAVASAANEPILLTDRDALPVSVTAYLASSGVTSSDVIGGTGVISATVAAGLPNATRHAGMSAYDTNNQVIQDFAGSLQFDTVYVANGVTGIDALAGAPLAVQTKSPIVLTDGKTVPAVAGFTHSKKADAVVTALGGEFVVPESVRDGVSRGAVTPDSNELKIVSISALDDTNRFLKMEFSKAVSGLEATNISMVNAKTGDAYGVKTVTLSANGLTAQMELFAGDDGYIILEDATEYTVTVNVSGAVLTSKFVRSAHLDEDDNARVTKIDSENRQITVSYIDSKDNNKSITLDVPTSSTLNFQNALGQVIRVWYDGNEELTKYQYYTKKIIHDAIEFDKADRIKTINEEVKYDLASDCVVIAYEGATNEIVAKTAADIKTMFFDSKVKFAYAKLIFNDDGDVERIYGYNATGLPILVEKVDGTYIQGYGSDELDLEDYRIVNALGMQISIKDIQPDSIVFFNSKVYGGDGIAIVLPALVKGEITDTFSDSFDLAGKNYDYSGVKYVNEDGDLEKLDDSAAEQLQAGGEVKAYFDAAGKLWYVKAIVGGVIANGDALYLQSAIDAYADAKVDGFIQVEGINSTGDVESYDTKISTLDKIKVTKTVSSNAKEVKYEVNEVFPGLAAGSANEIDEFAIATFGGGVYTVVNTTGPVRGAFIVALNDANVVLGPVVKLSDYATPTGLVDMDGDLDQDAADAALERTNNVVKVNKDDNGDVIGLEFNALAADLNSSGLDDKDNFANGFELGDSTLVYDVSGASKFDDPDEDDVDVTTWGELKKNGTDLSKDEAKVYYDEDGKVTYLVAYADSVADDSEYIALITSVDVQDNDVTRISAFVNGEKKTYQVKDSDASANEGDIAVIKVNEAGTIVTSLQVVPSRVISGKVDAVNVSNSEITVDGVVYKLGRDGEVYDATDADGSDYTVEGGLRDVDVNDYVVLGLSATGSHFVDVVALDNASEYAPVVGGFTLAPNAGAAETITMTVSKKLVLAQGAAVTGFTTSTGAIATAVYDKANDVIVLTSTTDGDFTALTKVTYTQATGNVVDNSSNELAAFAGKLVN